MTLQRIVRITPTNRSKSVFTVSFSAPLIKFLTSNEDGIPVSVALIEMSSGEVVEVNLQHNKVEFTGAVQRVGSNMFNSETPQGDFLRFNPDNLDYDIIKMGENNVL